MPEQKDVPDLSMEFHFAKYVLLVSLFSFL